MNLNTMEAEVKRRRRRPRIAVPDSEDFRQLEEVCWTWENLNSILYTVGMSGLQLAKQMRVDPKTISRWRNKKRQPSLADGVQLFLHVRPHVLAYQERHEEELIADSKAEEFEKRMAWLRSLDLEHE